MLGLHCREGFSLVAASGDYSLAAVCGLLIVAASTVAEHRLEGARTSLVVVHGLRRWGYRALEHRLNSCGAWA